jgi:cytochrome oxidase assembly protein ShyY1
MTDPIPAPPPRRSIPIVATAIVAAAILIMIGLGIWQLRRAAWKDGLVTQYAAARSLPPTAFPAVPTDAEALLFRRAGGFCLQVTGWRASAGRNRAGESGWRHIAACRTGGGEGPGMQVDVGWSNRSDAPDWRGGRVEGVIGPDGKHRILLVSTEAAPGLAPSALPSTDDVPNNHRSYAVQWFMFAAIAAIIYALSLRRRRGAPPAPPASPPASGNP